MNHDYLLYNLKALRIFLSDKNRWCCYTTARDRDCRTVGALDTQAVSWCLSGAISRVSVCDTSPKSQNSREKTRASKDMHDNLIKHRPGRIKALEKLYGINAIVDINDFWHTEHHHILEWIDHTIKEIQIESKSN